MRAVTSVLVVLVLALGVAACGGNGGGTTTTVETETETTSTQTESTGTETTAAGPQVVHVTVTNGLPAGGIVRASVNQGDRVVIVVDSDVSDEVHVHGYDVKKDVTAGGSVRIPLDATIPGRFEIELENRGTEIAELTVNP
jgi:hypothetical protein